MNKTTLMATILSLFLGITYFSLMPSAKGGYGQKGYGGFSSAPSIWYFGGPSFFNERSVRSGSVGGSRFASGGPRGGK